ncbi:hypothetical protein N7448_004565 [Penicillium atrosanguineum]|uniref:Uncharacterized protein n=1 Tax=Penicillium atrosanguineum TaxID=1132637 RepID=A0A9W9U0U8_9EURO|nr:Pre-mRNA-splicing factor rse1 [Penicillium atrosanguineum]KAJ5136011.1 hypothetical protein N7448_004565 [Penicillium atrosanguineum]KAJ5292363.1 Pre-mRNA-splicing factor rse1 [Penicillium atrosanguineum]KAJ5303616.1 hypothetical protein N7476_010415 [Penicillium atrosanguineum]
MESFPYEAGRPTGHFKLLEAYLQSSPRLKSLIFHWKARRTIAAFISNRAVPRFASTQCGRQGMRTSLRPMKFRSLQQVELVSATMDASQIGSFQIDHMHSIRDFKPSRHNPANTWDPALAPLTQLSGSEQWKTPKPTRAPSTRQSYSAHQELNQQQIQRAKKDGLRRLAKTRAPSSIRGRLDHVKRLLPSSVFWGW